MNKKLLSLLAALPLLALTAHADSDMPVNPNVSSHQGAPGTGAVARTGTGDVTIRLINSCFATNLRSVANPLAPTSIIEANMKLTVTNEHGDATDYPLWIKYPAGIVTAEGMTATPDKDIDPSLFGGMDGMKAALYGNTVQIKVPAIKIALALHDDGTVQTTTSKVSFGSPSFTQHITSCEGGPVYGSWGYSNWKPTYPCGAYMGHEGALSAKVSGVNVASDQSAVYVDVSFPGQTGFCGGYFSPLMLFFDDARPVFNGMSDFQLSAAGKTTWVEKGAPGAFLALDRNHNGKIDGKEELFGDQDSDKNGFDSLKELDSTKDGVIDAKDKLWKSLLLWSDKNGDGISQPDELEPLNKRVTKISLKYKSTVRAYGATAQARESGDFWFKDAKGKTKKGKVEDIWFAPINAVQK